MSTPDPSSIPYFAHKRFVEREKKFYYFTVSPNLRFVRIHGFSDPIVTVRVRERVESDPPSPYYGWLATGASEYTMVWRSRTHFESCFQYNSDEAVSKGRGRRVNLIVEECG